MSDIDSISTTLNEETCEMMSRDITKIIDVYLQQRGYASGIGWAVILTPIPIPREQAQVFMRGNGPEDEIYRLLRRLVFEYDNSRGPACLNIDSSQQH